MPKWNKHMGRECDSKWEEELKNGIFKELEYHPLKLPYTMSHTYQPDWIYKADSKVIYIEAKGTFREASEMAKYVAVRGTLDSEYEELIFLFMKPQAPIFFRAKRKDGTKITHQEWADKNGFRWYDEDTIHELIGSK